MSHFGALSDHSEVVSDMKNDTMRYNDMTYDTTCIDDTDKGADQRSVLIREHPASKAEYRNRRKRRGEGAFSNPETR